MPESTDLQRLVVGLEVRMAQYDKAMKRAAVDTDKKLSGIERRFKQAETRISATGKSLFAGFNPGSLIAGFSAGAVVREVQKVISSVAQIADQAKRAGVSAENIQAIGVAAHQAGVETGEMVDLLSMFNRRIGEAATKGGELADLLKANNVPLRDANGQVRQTIDLFFDVIDLIARAKSLQEGATAGQIAFGRAVGSSLPLLREGSAEMRRMMQAAKDSGAVIREELVAVADEMDDAWSRAWDSWSGKAKSAVLTVFNFYKENAERQAKAGYGLGSLILGDLSGTRSGLEARQAAKLAERDELVRQIEFARATNTSAPILPQWEQSLAEVNKELDDIIRKVAFIQGGPGLSRNPFDIGRGTIIPGKTSPAAKAGGTSTKKSFLDFIASVESGPGGYNATLDSGAYTGGDVELVTKTLDEIREIQTAILNHPLNKKNSSAVGRYQIVRKTLDGLRRDLGLTGKELFTPDLQDMLGTALVQRRGRDAAGLRNEWEGLRGKSDEEILAAYDASAAERIAVVEKIAQAEIDGQKRIADAYKQYGEARTEADAEEKARLAERSQTFFDEQARLQQEAQDRWIEKNRESDERLIESMDELRSASRDVLGGFLQDLDQGASLSEAFGNAIDRLKSKAIDALADQLINLLLGPTGTAQPGLLGGLFTGLPGFASGGSFRVGGAGGTDSKLVAFRATPGERVDIRPPSLAVPRGSYGQSAPRFTVEAKANPFFYTVVRQISGQGDARALDTARRQLPATHSRMAKLGTTTR